MSATSAPGQRPAIVVTRMIAGGKKMNEVLPRVIGYTTQWSAAAATATTSANAKRRAMDFSIHGHSRAKRNSLEMRETRSPPGASVSLAEDYSAEAGSSHRRWLTGMARQSLVDPGPLGRFSRPDRRAWFEQTRVIQ